jgi:hypothetical protein
MLTLDIASRRYNVNETEGGKCRNTEPPINVTVNVHILAVIKLLIAEPKGDLEKKV